MRCIVFGNGSKNFRHCYQADVRARTRPDVGVGTTLFSFHQPSAWSASARRIGPRSKPAPCRPTLRS